MPDDLFPTPEPETPDNAAPHPEIASLSENMAAILQAARDGEEITRGDLEALKASTEDILSMAAADTTVPPGVMDAASAILEFIESMLPQEEPIQGEVEQFAGKGLTLGSIVEKWEGSLSTPWGAPNRAAPGNSLAGIFKR